MARARTRENWRRYTPHYRRRDDALHFLGFHTYHQYLASSLWADIRAKVLAERPMCGVCGVKATQVHHHQYDRATLMGNCLTALEPLCRRCHEYGEFNRSGGKTPLEICNHRLRLRRQLLRRRRKKTQIPTSQPCGEVSGSEEGVPR